MGKDVTQFCLDVLNNGRELGDVNKTSIIFLKVEMPRNMSQYRPISLCTVVYKIISRMLVNIFKKALELCIGENQGKFVHGRHIIDNILITYEVLHSLKKKRGGKTGSFSLKLDMSKAYDKVEWTFLEDMMRNLAFCEEWVHLILRCVKTVSYSVVLNGVKGEEFKPSRGLR